MTDSQPREPRKLRSAAEIRGEMAARRAKTGAKMGNDNARGNRGNTEPPKPPMSPWTARAIKDDVAALKKDASPQGRRYAAAISAPRPGQRLPYLNKPYSYADADGRPCYVATLAHAKRGVDLAHLQKEARS